jgi:predicted transcriptional regulator
MTIKSKPRWLNISSLPSNQRKKVIELVLFIDSRGDAKTKITDVERKFNLDYRNAWQILDLTWDCGLIAKVKTGNWSCYWKSRGDGPVFVDHSKMRSSQKTIKVAG